MNLIKLIIDETIFHPSKIVWQQTSDILYILFPVLRFKVAILTFEVAYLNLQKN